MSDARTLLLEGLAVIPDGEKVASLFAEDGVVELPFLHSAGMPARHQGRTQIRGFYNQVGKLYSGFGFKPEDITVLIETPDQVLAEYMTYAGQQGPVVASIICSRDGSLRKRDRSSCCENP
jgi:uncharacterized protein